MLLRSDKSSHDEAETFGRFAQGVLALVIWPLGDGLVKLQATSQLARGGLGYRADGIPGIYQLVQERKSPDIVPAV